MHDLLPLDPAMSALGTLSEVEIDRAMHFARSATAPSTLVAYASDYRSWVAFATARGALPMPPHAGVVAAWLSAQADAGRKASSIGGLRPLWRTDSKQAGIDPPVTATAGVRSVLKGIRRELGAAKKGKEPIVADMLMPMLKLCPDTLAGKRDAALLSLCFAGAFRRSEVVALEVSDLTPTKDGLRIRIRRSKTDGEGVGVDIAVIRGVKIQPVAHVEAWLEASGIIEGPIFRAVALGSRMSVGRSVPTALAASSSATAAKWASIQRTTADTACAADMSPARSR